MNEHQGDGSQGRIAGALAVAGVYAYFLIFPQFAFLHALNDAGMPANPVRFFMATMAAAGILSSLAAARLRDTFDRRCALGIGVVVSASAAWLFAGSHPTPGSAFAIALLSGSGLGWMTVSLAVLIPGLAGAGNIPAICGFGTGLAYAAANFPPLFNTDTRTQSVVAGLALIPTLVCALRHVDEPGEPDPEAPRETDYRRGVALFFVLIGTDSACFAIIQHNAAIKSVSWGRDADLVANGLVHAVFAAVTGLRVTRRHFSRWMAGAAAALVAAAVMLNAGGAAATWAHLPYAAGVSVYSTLLIAWLPLFCRSGYGGRVARLYAVSGWVASALGIGMALDLGHIPLSLPAGAGLAFAVLLGRGGRTPFR